MKDSVAFHEGFLENTPELSAVSHQYWQDVFCMPCFWWSSKGGVWYCKSRRTGGPGVPGTPEGIWNLKTCLHTEHCFHWTASCTAQHGATAHTAQIALQVLMAVVPTRLFLTFSFHWQHLICLLTWSYSTSLLPLGLCQEHTEHILPSSWLKTANSGA